MCFSAPIFLHDAREDRQTDATTDGTKNGGKNREGVRGRGSKRARAVEQTRLFNECMVSGTDIVIVCSLRVWHAATWLCSRRHNATVAQPDFFSAGSRLKIGFE